MKRPGRLTAKRIGAGPRPIEALSALEGREGAFLLESALRSGRLARWSYLGFDPFVILAAKERVTWTCENGHRTDLEGTAFNELGRLLERFRTPGGDNREGLPEFRGGAVGYFGYELGRLVEKLPARAPDDLDLPDMHLGFYDRCLAFDHHEGEWWGCCAEFGKCDPGDALGELQQILADAQSQARSSELEAQRLAAAGALRSNFAAEEYTAVVSRVIEYIRAGDIFQANFTQRFEADWPTGAVDLYGRLRDVNPAPFAGYYDFGAGQVVSASPELFLKVSGRRVTTRPIKGTRPRGDSEAEDRRLAEELLASPKDRAELTMIVDLERNDLGRVCSYDSVKVTEHLALETYPTVHHLVSTVVGRLHDDRNLVDLLKATFPGGSITGAPKVRAMEIIDELERSARGVYTGAMGYIGFDGTVQLNLPIRTFTVTGGRAYFSVGGGIVADSSPEGEYQESLDKARGLIAALEGCAAREARP